jgi:hypothetical protein
MPRQVWLWGVGVGLVALALAVTDWLLFRLPGVHEANFRRIREWMTLQEVEKILGGPAQTQGDWRPVFGLGMARSCTHQDETRWIRAWGDGRGNYILVGFDNQGRVTDAEFQQASGTSFLRRFRSWRSFCSWMAG